MGEIENLPTNIPEEPFFEEHCHAIYSPNCH